MFITLDHYNPYRNPYITQLHEIAAQGLHEKIRNKTAETFSELPSIRDNNEDADQLIENLVLPDLEPLQNIVDGML